MEIFRQEAIFFAGASEIKQLPSNLLPEIAFIGRSNVGKSSLINSVCRRKSLARISNTPGRTRQINFFSIANKFALVDLPGYGYAKVHSSEKAKWEKLIVYYLQNSKQLKLINLLVDARRGFKEDDIEILELMREYKRHVQILVTKTDKKDAIKGIKDELNSIIGEEYNVILTSSKNGEGIREVQQSIVKSLKD